MSLKVEHRMGSAIERMYDQKSQELEETETLKKMIQLSLEIFSTLTHKEKNEEEISARQFDVHAKNANTTHVTAHNHEAFSQIGSAVAGLSAGSKYGMKVGSKAMNAVGGLGSQLTQATKTQMQYETNSLSSHASSARESAQHYNQTKREIDGQLSSIDRDEKDTIRQVLQG